MRRKPEAFVVAINDKNTSNIDSAVENLEKAPHLDEKSDELKERLKLLLLRARQSGAAAAASPQRGGGKPVGDDEIKQDFITWRKEYNQWLKTSGRNYSGLLQLTAPERQK